MYLQDHNEYNSSVARSQTNTARLEGLRPGMVYVVQVRARTVAGYGKYSGKMCFQTLTDGEWAAGVCRGRRTHSQPQLWALIGLNVLASAKFSPSGQHGKSQVIYRVVFLTAS